MPRVHACGGVREGGVLANHHVICLEPPLRFTPQHSTLARLQSIQRLGPSNTGGVKYRDFDVCP